MTLSVEALQGTPLGRLVFVRYLIARMRSLWGRIVTAFVVMSLFACLMGGITVYAVYDAGRLVRGGPERGTSSTALLAASVDLADLHEAARSVGAEPDLARRSAANRRIDELRTRLTAWVAQLATNPTTQGDDWGSIAAALDQWDAARAAMIADPRSTDAGDRLDHAAGAATRAIRGLTAAAAERDDRRLAQARTAFDRDLRWLVAAAAAVLLVSALIGWRMARWIVQPIAAASLTADRIAKGQLDTDIHDLGGDELGKVLAAMGAMRNNIVAVMEREVALRRSAQTRLADALESSRDGIIVVDADLRIALANAQASDFLGASTGLLVPGTPIMHLTGASRTSRKLLLDLMGLDGGAEVSRLPDGRWLRVSRSSTRDGGFIALCSDISVQKDQEAKLKATNLRLDAALENMSQGLCLFGSDMTLHVINRRFCEIFGLAPDAVTAGMALSTIMERLVDAGHFFGRTATDIVDEETAVFSMREHSMRFVEIGGSRVVGIAVGALSDGGWLATYEDVTERRQAEERIAFMARHDALTSLPNRVLFSERVEQAIALAQRGRLCAVFCLDLDHFKHVNDTLGHPLGDEMLRIVAQRLQGCARDLDTVARLGGDEFALVQSGIDSPEQAVALANRILETLSEPFSLQGHVLSIGVSIGISLAPGDGQDHGKLLKNADVALYKAKEDGRGTWRFFEAEMDSRLQARRETETDLRRALEGDQFEVFYQPQFDLRTDRISGFEALVRWRHPVRGLVPPNDFIPLAEEIGLIREIGIWVLRTACKEASRWETPLRIAVNVSPVQLRQLDFCSTVADALSAAGLSPGRLELEVTESVMLSNSSAALDVLHQIRALGVQLSMDDFGTGYSSLTSLRSFPFDKIKIDKSFVKDLCTSRDAEPVVRAVIVLGAGLGIRITAEGVETAEQLAQLRIEGCNEVQGYLISPPKPASFIPVMLERWNAGSRRALISAVA